MFRLISLWLLIVAMTSTVVVDVADAFHAPSVTPTRSHGKTKYHAARSVPGAHYRPRTTTCSTHNHKINTVGVVSMKMSEDKETEIATEKKAVISADGTFYDDEVSCFLSKNSWMNKGIG
jgi:hypothetical protein